MSAKHEPGPWEKLGAASNPLIAAASDLLEAHIQNERDIEAIATIFASMPALPVEQFGGVCATLIRIHNRTLDAINKAKFPKSDVVGPR